jgi:Tfp pilus assembly protein PilF
MAATEPGSRRARWRKRRTAGVLTAVALAGGLLAALGWLAPFAREVRLRRLDLHALRREARARPNDPELFLALGRRLRQRGEIHPAVVMISRAYDVSDGECRFTAAKIGALVDAADFEAAAGLAANAAARWPSSGELHAQVSRLDAGQGDFSAALREAETAVRLAPGQAEGWQALGVACSLNKRPSQSFVAFRRALQQDPQDAWLLADYGEALMKYGRAAEAEAVLRRSVALAPRAGRPAGLLGQLQASRARLPGERAAARALLGQAVQREPWFVEWRYQLALLDLRDSREREAIRLLNSCLADDARYGEAHLALGQAYQKLGQGAAARQAFAAWQRFSDYRREAAHLEIRLRRAPVDRELLRRSAELHAANGQPLLAKEYRRRLQEVEAGTPAVSGPAGDAIDTHRREGS